MVSHISSLPIDNKSPVRIYRQYNLIGVADTPTLRESHLTRCGFLLCHSKGAIIK